MFGSKDKNSLNLGDYLGTDIHSHVIPGIDDGAAKLVDSIALIHGFIDLGYKKIVTTPHIYAEVFPNTPATINSAFEILLEEVKKLNLPLNLKFAAEYFLDFEFLSLTELGNLLSFGSRYVLIETSFYSPYQNLLDVIFDLAVRGYKPILAHPERYMYSKPKNWFQNLKEKGCLFQVNILSFEGYYGKLPQKTAYELLDLNLIDFLGSDLHHEKGLNILKDFRPDKKLISVLESDRLLNKAL